MGGPRRRTCAATTTDPPTRPPWPKISIVTPNFNYGELVETTIRSVLVQGYPNLEYVVIDDGSTDGSVAAIEPYRSRLAYFEHQENQGQYPAINKGFAHATGDVFGWINSDDVYLPWTLRAVGTIFARHPEVQWVTGHPCRIHEGTVHTVGRLTPYPRRTGARRLFPRRARRRRLDPAGKLLLVPQPVGDGGAAAHRAALRRRLRALDALRAARRPVRRLDDPRRLLGPRPTEPQRRQPRRATSKK